MKKILLSALASLAICSFSYSQGSANYSGGLKVKLNEDGSKYFRLITWHQVWARYNQNNEGSTRLGEKQDQTFDVGLRRSRFLMFSQISDSYTTMRSTCSLCWVDEKKEKKEGTRN